MRILSVYDLSARESIDALRHMRHHNLVIRPGVKEEDIVIEDDVVLRRVYDLVGGRSSYLNRVARANNMIGEWWRFMLPSVVMLTPVKRRPNAWLISRRIGCSQSKTEASLRSTECFPCDAQLTLH
jgi:hypothetical protein